MSKGSREGRSRKKGSRERRDQKFKSSPYKLYRTKRLAELFDCDGSTIWRWRKTGILPEPAFQNGGITAWTEEQIAPLYKQLGAADAH